MTDRSHCPFCLKDLVPYPMGRKNGYDLFSCRACGSAMTNPSVTQEVRKVFLNEIEPNPVHVKNTKGTIEKHMRLLNRLSGGSAAGKRFLDASAMQGYGVEAASEAGFESILGIDTHEFFTQFAKKHYGLSKFENISIEKYAERGQQADVIFCIEGFSSQIDLESYTAALTKILSPDGKLYIEDGDGNSLWLPKKFARWAFAEPPMNFIYPSYNGIKSLLSRHGLKVIQKFWTMKPIMRLIVTKE